MDLISAIIPTLNRPDLLMEAIDSLVKQTFPPGEIVVVDDGSTVPVDEKKLQDKFGRQINVIRNEKPKGLAFARNQGVEHSKGRFIIHLDDDDLLAKDAIHQCHSLFSLNNDLDIVFMGVQGFGKRADHFNKVQSEAIARVKAIGHGEDISPGIIKFHNHLINALLVTVPSSFQHVMTSRRTWDTVSQLRLNAYKTDPDIQDAESAKKAITGPLRDSEWAIYSSITCNNTILLNKPIYLARCEGQGYSSTPNNRDMHIKQGIKIKMKLHHASMLLPEFKQHHKVIRNNLADTYFNAAYFYYRNKQRNLSLNNLISALRLQMSINYLKLLTKIILKF